MLPVELPLRPFKEVGTKPGRKNGNVFFVPIYVDVIL
jgi:hypothetical protein